MCDHGEPKFSPNSKACNKLGRRIDTEFNPKRKPKHTVEPQRVWEGIKLSEHYETSQLAEVKLTLSRGELRNLQTREPVARTYWANSVRIIGVRR